MHFPVSFTNEAGKTREYIISDWSPELRVIQLQPGKSTCESR